ncbi:hypothetical protein BGZ98_000960 [Dissophora globulifera]|nr:hypothetical protein BGZ98_000960 [Dissophora globulifera]
MHSTQLTTTASAYPAQSIVHSSPPNATSATKIPSSPSLFTTARTVLKSDGDDRHASSWRFPSPLGAKDRRDTGPVQAWASTSEALSHFYSLLHQIKSSSISASASSTCSSALALQSALQHYAYLSHLQSVHNTILVPRKDARTLFLLQGRSHKTLKNLEALLRIAVDLIWLNEKGRSKRRHARRAAAVAGGVDIAHATSEPQTAPAPDSVSSAARYIHSPADNHHGLRASEYAIIMNWIGSMSALETTAYSGSSSMDDNTDGSSGPDPSSTTHQHRVGGHIGALDRAWAIWQDLLLTGMKPDVVLYTVLMDQFLKAKEHSRANQIWDHMHPRDNDGHHHDEYVNTDNSRMQQEPSDSVSKPLSHGVGIHASSSSTRTTKLGFYSTDHGSTRASTSKKHVSSVSENAIANVQMYSVLMQNHILNRDLQGVALMYQQLVQAADKSPSGAKSDSSGGGRRKAKGSARHAVPLPPLQVNTVIVNQILKVLVDLGDVKAAKEIYTEMKLHQDHHQQQHPDVAATARLSHGVACTSPLSLTSTPLHHRAFRRRSTWLRKARAIALETSTIDHTSAPTTSIRPDKTTYRLMLGLAMRIGDEDLEQLVLDDLSLSILE